MKKKAKVIALFLVLAMTLSLVGCSSNNPTAGTQSPSSSTNNDTSNQTEKPEEIVLKFTYKQAASNDLLEKWLEEKKVIERFEAENPGIKIELTPISSSEGDYATLLALKLSSETTAPDIFMEDTYMTATDAAAGYLACLDDYVANWDEWSHYLDGTKEAVKGTDGKIYGIPISTDSRGIFYNYKVFRDAGIPTPWQPTNWEEILDAARKIKAHDPSIEPFYMIVGKQNGEGVSMQTFEMLLYGTGDQLYENGKWVVKSKGLSDTFKFIEQVYKTEKLGVSLDVALASDVGAQVNKGLADGTIGMYLAVATTAGNWTSTGSYPVENLEQVIGFAAMPTQYGGDPATITMCGGWSWAISSHCKYKDEAFKFLAFCGNKENATWRSLYDGRMSPRDDSTDIEEYAMRPYIKEMTAYMANAYVRPKHESYAMVSTQIQTIVEELVSTDMTAEQAAEEYKSRVISVVGNENTLTK
ncbi:MAG: extracellular solute-binding protein [Clostridiaceae bacterium]|nr:extracellular solute-binding protein [Clostridiaceae bacterium]